MYTWNFLPVFLSTCRGSIYFSFFKRRNWHTLLVLGIQHSNSKIMVCNINCNMVTTVSLVTICYLTKLTNTLHYIPMTYFFYNWKFIHLNPLYLFHSPTPLLLWQLPFCPKRVHCFCFCFFSFSFLLHCVAWRILVP